MLLLANNAKGTLASHDLESISLHLNEGELFPSITTPGVDYFYVRIGTDETNEVVKIIDRVGDALAVDSPYIQNGPYSEGTDVILTVCKEIFDDIDTRIGRTLDLTSAENHDKSIGVGYDYETLADAIDAYRNASVIDGVTNTFTFFLMEGEHSASADNTAMRCAKNISLRGLSGIIGLTSIESSSGSAGAWSIVLNVSDVSELAVDMLVSFSSLTGGTNPDFLQGAAKITNVDSENTQITISSVNLSASPPSGLATGTITYYKSRLTGMIDLYSSFAEVMNIGFDHATVSVGAPQFFDNNAFLGTTINIYSSESGFINCVFTESGLTIPQAIYVSSENCVWSHIDGTALAINGGSYYCPESTSIYGCTDGVSVERNGTFYSSNIVMESITGTAMYAGNYGYAEWGSATMSGNGTNYNPALNTQGNKYGFINDGT